jgi:hypothetical protein
VGRCRSNEQVRVGVRARCRRGSALPTGFWVGPNVRAPHAGQSFTAAPRRRRLSVSSLNQRSIRSATSAGSPAHCWLAAAAARWGAPRRQPGQDAGHPGARIAPPRRRIGVAAMCAGSAMASARSRHHRTTRCGHVDNDRGLVGDTGSVSGPVAVLAVDPSSPFRGRALLGDRIRMAAHINDSDVLIRSVPTRGHLRVWRPRFRRPSAC